MSDQAQDQIMQHFQSIIVRAGYNQDGSYNLETQSPDVATKLGTLFFDYLVASCYDTSWEGFTDQDQEGIARLLEDMNVAHEAM